MKKWYSILEMFCDAFMCSSEIRKQYLQTGYLCVIEDASAIIGANDGVFPILTEVSSRDESSLPVYFIPQCNFFVRNVPKAKFSIQGAT